MRELGEIVAYAGRRLKVQERIVWFMIKVKSRGNETAEQLIRRFKKMCEKEGLTKDIKKNLYYDKPSERRRRESRKLEKRLLQEKMEATAAQHVR